MAKPGFFKRLRGVWMSDETHFRLFDMASQMINNSWRNSRLKLAKFYGNYEHISKTTVTVVLSL